MGDSQLTSASSGDDKTKAVLDALTTLPKFDYTAYENGIQDLLGVDSNGWSNVCSSDLYGETPTLAGVSNIVQRFKVQTIALGVSRNSQYGFSNTVVMNSFQDRLNTTSSSIVVPVYRMHLEKHMAANGVPLPIADLAKDVGFCRAFISRILTPEFINDALIARFLDQPGYTEAIAFLYERLRPSLLQQPDTVASRVSLAGSNVPLSTVVLNSLPNNTVYSQTVMASQDLSAAGKTQDFLSASLPLVWSDNKLLQGPQFPTVGVAWANLWMANTFATGVIANLINSDVSYQYFPGPPGGVGSTFAIYGDKLWQWIKSQEANGNGDVFHVTQPENFNYLSPFGCFAPGTMITTEVGEVAIEDLEPSTLVMARAPGHYGRSSSERVENPTVIAQPGRQHLVVPLYGFNGEEPFVTDGHIFFTTTGPRAINPATATAENSSAKIGHLREGDVLLRLNHDRSGYDKVKIATITRDGAKCSTVHGLHLAKGSDGGHRYHANGYWVGENYPQLTIKGLLNKYHTMTPADQRTFVKHVAKLPHCFRQVLGPAVYDTVQRTFATIGMPTHANSASIQRRQRKEPTSILGAVEEAGRHHISIMSAVAHYRLVNHDELRKSRTKLDTTTPRYARTIADLNGDVVLPEVTMCHGAVVVHDQGSLSLVRNASMSHLAVQWSSPIRGHPGMYQHGVLRAVYHGKAALGYVATGPAEAKSLGELGSITPVMAVSTANTYNINFGTKIFASSTEAIAAKSSDPDGWTPFWKVVIGLVHDPVSGGFKIALSLPDLDQQWVNIHGKTAADTPPYQVIPPKLDQKTYVMSITVQVCPGLEDKPGLLDTLKTWNLKDDQGKPVPAGPAFNQFSVYLNLETNEVHGYSYELSPGETSGTFKNGPIHGLTTPGSSTVSHIRKTVNDLVQNAPCMPGSFGSADVNDSSANFHAPAQQAAQMLATKLFTAKDLSIGDLQTTPAPSDTDLNKFSQVYMQNAANYWRRKEETDLFGNDQAAMKTALPTSGSLTNNLNSEGQKWLGIYDRGLMLQALQRDAKYSGNFTDAEGSKMQYYWQGGQKGCLSSGEQFNRISEICGREAFLALTPGLKPYIEDSRDWGNLFFNFVSTDEQLNLQVFGMSLDPGASNLTNRYCMILNALDFQNREYATTLWRLVRDKLLCSVSNGTITGDQKETPEFLQCFVAQLILQVQTGSSTELLDQLKIDLASLQKHWGTNDANEIAARLFSAGYELGQCFIEVMKDMSDIISHQSKASFSEVMSRWENKVRLKYPDQGDRLVAGLRFGTAFIGLAIDALGLYQSIKYLQAWGTLTAPEKAEAVIGMVQMVVRTGTDLAKIIQTMRGKDPNSFDFKINCVKWNNTTGEVGGHTVIERIENAEGDMLIQPALDDEKIGDIREEAVEGITKTFRLSEAVASIIAIAANIAAAVCMGYQIRDDFKKGEAPGIEAMDIITEVVTCLQVLSGIAELGAMVLGIECIAIPVVGVLIAVVGIILMLCEMFVPRKPPPDPVKGYINDNKLGFLQPIPSPPAVALTYKLTGQSGGTTVPEGQKCTITLSVTNPANLNIKFRSLALRLPVGSDGDELFVAPSGKDEKTGKSPIYDVVTYDLDGKPDGWSVQGAPVANNTDGSMMAKIISTNNTDGSSIPAGGLTLHVTGTVNKTAGKVTFRLLEGAVSRPGVQDIPAGDYYTFLYLTKA
ncbi:uncharacterized protein F5Z01DRAFT_673975 [Emericellopsis atlantica]|uniref:Uncharacterized protein n=1 Tax=Emericellopsis atlantica TaxID=2614577 RepID=A0A9P7ZMM1_9HYPO|nr:uncharacterized protein F5Z01DRAFT_673975 [Emericellopsis atlantica]KAG9254830.1 hypothetical protein F5Z01DRAFT_673975 [Emericellopsis atlantica]